MAPQPFLMSTDHDFSFGDLTPEFMLDALDAVGLYGDGRMLQLNSYENRVLQLHRACDRVRCARKAAGWALLVELGDVVPRPANGSM